MQSAGNQPENGNPWIIWIVMAAVCAALIPLLTPKEPAPPPAPAPTTAAAPSMDPPMVEVSANTAAAATTKSYQAESIHKYRPEEEPANGYVTSTVCNECHEGQHGSWHATYHRSMTQVANAKTILGDFSNQTVSFPDGGSYRLGKHGDEHWVDILQHPKIPKATPDKPLRLPIVLTTGSHHMQVYWFATGNGHDLGILPLVHLNGEERWIPRDAAFIKPPDEAHSLEMGRWNYTCNTCHTTDPRSRYQRDHKSYDTRVSEFGIACESCHGPGEAHVKHQRAITAGQTTTAPDPIFNPGTADHIKSSQACGACHVSHRRVDPKGGFTNYLPGTDYDQARMPLSMSEEFLDQLLEGATNKAKLKQDYQEQLLAQFWPDGAIRVAGREYNGLIESACHTKGEMSCVSCHRLHQSGSDKRPVQEWANDMLQPSKQGDQGCLQCHAAADYRTTAHTHHDLKSAGSSCYNCHMPHSAYGLLKSVRSHTIDSPKVDVAHSSGRPNACNLCHLDQTLEWTAQHLNTWYQQPIPDLAEEHRTVAAGPLWTLKGDAGMRALMAWHLGWEPARKAAKSDWIGPYLAVLIDDDYAAVRVIASRTMRRRTEFSQIPYDFLSRPQGRRIPALQLIAQWRKAQANQTHNPGTLIGKDGNPQMEKFQALLKARDRRPMVLAE